MSRKDYETLRRMIEDGELTLDVVKKVHPLSDKSKTLAMKQTMTSVGEKDEEFNELKSEYKDIAVEIDDIIEKYEDGEMTMVSHMWEIGRIIEESGDKNVPNLQVLSNIFNNRSGYSPDSLSVHRKIYEAFPEKNFSDEHSQTVIREFIMQPKDNDRGRRGYDRYKQHSYNWPNPVRRAWCVTNESKIDDETVINLFVDNLQEKYKSSKNPTPSKDTLASYLQEMTVVSDSLSKISKSEAKSRL